MSKYLSLVVDDGMAVQVSVPVVDGDRITASLLLYGGEASITIDRSPSKGGPMFFTADQAELLGRTLISMASCLGEEGER